MVPGDSTRSGSSRGRNILLTGRPGIGKTTVIVRLSELVKTRALAGFYTDEIRQGPRRQGFRATTILGQTTTMAHVNVKGGRRVGRYGVDVTAFEGLVLPELGRPADLVLIDEIGEMECFSSRFVEAVRALLDSPTFVVATVALRGGGLIAEVKERPDVDIWEVTASNRDDLPRRLASAIAM